MVNEHDAECDASGGKNTSSDESIRGNNTAVVVTADELPSNATLSGKLAHFHASAFINGFYPQHR